MTPAARGRPGRRDWVRCGVDVAAVLLLLTLMSLTGVLWWGLLAVAWGALTARQLHLAIRSHAGGGKGESSPPTDY